MKLSCALVGAQVHFFSVDIDAKKTVADLKIAIQKKLLEYVNVDKLQLYLAKKYYGDGTWLTENDVKNRVKATARLTLLNSARLTLQRVQLRDGNEQHDAAGNRLVHVLVVVPSDLETVPTKKRKLAEIGDLLAPFSPETILTQKKKLAEIGDLISPSLFATCKGGGSWVKWLKKLDGQVECHRVDRSDDKLPIPIVLLNETFARFQENCQQIKFGQKDCEFVTELCGGLSTPYDSKAKFAQKARELLTGYLLVDNPVAIITPATVDGSWSDGSHRFGETLLLNLTCKLQKGDGGGDPTMENVAYYIKKLPKVIDRQYPCFLVNICGPLMNVFGIVNTGDEEVICEPLVVGFPLLYFDNESMLISLIRMCVSLKTAVKELTDECYKISGGCRRSVPCVPPAALDRLRFPYKDSVEVNGERTTFQYLEVIYRYVFKARQVETNAPCIIKFSKRYGKEVHEYCSKVGFAPELLFYESLPNGWVFIVMEELQLVPLRKANDRATVRDQLLKIQKALRDMSFVHGDLRENNVLWDSVKNRVVLIDFDWSGQDGVATYPPFMNTEIAWPSGAECGKPLRVAHDEYWFESIAAQLK
ncbi:hypothetical protein DVH05_024705 [Phytophthora capsici]|nr:hypothetical protein DVH05_024705 [Phytophthora capsici]